VTEVVEGEEASWLNFKLEGEERAQLVKVV